MEFERALCRDIYKRISNFFYPPDQTMDKYLHKFRVAQKLIKECQLTPIEQEKFTEDLYKTNTSEQIIHIIDELYAAAYIRPQSELKNEMQKELSLIPSDALPIRKGLRKRRT